MTCVSASECWAVGHYVTGIAGSADQTLIERWDGTSWTIVSSPNALASTNNYLSGVTCLSASNCWAVGYSRVGTADQTLIERWDGTSWAIVTAPNNSSAQNNILAGVTCVSASDCWAVGHSNNGTADQTLVERWDGSSWTIVPASNTSLAQNNVLAGVTCVSASDCWAVGHCNNGSADQTLIERWDGTSWSIVSSPNTSPSERNFLCSVTCVSASDCRATGAYVHASGVSQTLTEHYGAVSPLIPASVVSRKTHGTAGTFDVNLPITGTPGIECRNEVTPGNHHVVFSFGTAMTVTGATVAADGSGKTAETDGPPVLGADGREITVHLKNVSNAQTITVTLVGVSDGATTSDVSVQMAVLLGDTTGSGAVNSSDISQTKSQSGQLVTGSNFRTDVTASGSINSSDISLVKSKSGTGLP